MEESSESRFALLPLTVFDRLFERTTFVTGWLVEGRIDPDALSEALDRVTRKWRMLAGRLQSSKDEDNTVKYQLKIPLGPIPDDYSTYNMTTTTSGSALSHYTNIPIPSTSTSLPLSLFLHPTTPRSYATWESTDWPLTCWHLTYFPASHNKGVDYTCIGFARSHGIFDGGGAAFIMNALIAEASGREWPVPPLPHEGLNVNPVEWVLASAASSQQYSNANDTLPAYSQIGPGGVLKLAASHVKERFWKGADRRIIFMPKVVLDYLVEDVRSTLNKEKKQVGHVTTGDILVAWMLKTVYSSGTAANTKVHCANFANFRYLLEPEYKEASTFPHNVFVPLPYPILTVEDLKSFSLSTLANLLAASRLSLSMDHVVSGYKLLQNQCFPNAPGTDETLTVSNVSASRILESDWKVLGSQRTLCGYRYQAVPTEVMFTNAIYIAGRLDDGSTVLDVTLNRERFDLLAGEVQRLNARIARNQVYST